MDLTNEQWAVLEPMVGTMLRRAYKVDADPERPSVASDDTHI